MYLSLLPLAYLIIIPLGIYLLFYKRKQPALTPEEIIKTLRLSEQGQKVKLKELRNETAPVFTRQWIQEYWVGDRSVLHAWITWIIFGGIFLRILNIPIYMKFYEYDHHNIPITLSEYDYLYAIFIICYAVFTSIVIWRCSRNSSLFYKYFSRILFFCGLLVLPFIR